MRSETSQGPAWAVPVIRSARRAVARTAAVALALGAALVAAAPAAAQPAGGLPPLGPDQLAFSVANMDRSVPPGVDFYRYAAGGWLARVERPERHGGYGFFEIVADRVQQQMRRVLEQAAEAAPTAPAGSPARQVGTLYRAYLDTGARDAAGLAPLRPWLERVDAISDRADLARFMAVMARDTGRSLLLQIAPDVDLADSKATILYVGAGTLGLPAALEDVLEEPDGGPRLTGYRTYLIETLAVAGLPAAEAARIADLSIAIDRALHAAKLPPADAGDPGKIYNPVSRAGLQAQLPSLDLALLLRALSVGQPDRLILTEPRYLPVLSDLLARHSIAELRDYVRLQVVLALSPHLGTAFDAPLAGLNRALLGTSVLPSREERALELITAKLGHPVSRLYVENFFPPETRRQAAEMVGLVKAAFVARMPHRAWLSDATRAAAIEKLDALSFRIGYPDRWIDHAGVAVTHDLAGSLVALSRFAYDRARDKLGRPEIHDDFADPHTLPIIVNAGYNPSVNGFEVPAAILQPPMFDPALDPAVNFCRIGAVLGHEMTHGFDRAGKQSDKAGNLRNWWQPADAAAFDALAAQLIAQANAYEVLPGLTNASGAQQVGENMADLGGITLAHAALRAHLARHPEQDVSIDGLTQDQRCFIAWAQIWAWKGKDEILRSQVARDPHPPSAYRAVAPVRHLDAFHAAFGIKEGDPMWLAPEQRVRAW